MSNVEICSLSPFCLFDGEAANKKTCSYSNIQRVCGPEVSKTYGGWFFAKRYGSSHLISEAQYTVDEAALPEGLAQSLQVLLPVRTRPIVRHRLVLLDTFNGRIAAIGGRLTKYVEKEGER